MGIKNKFDLSKLMDAELFFQFSLDFQDVVNSKGWFLWLRKHPNKQLGI